MKMYLTFICRDNQDTIEEMMDSCKPIIDGVIACDTGSTDKTVEIIETWCKKNNLPCTVYQDAWVNFGYNRTRMMQYCEQVEGVDYVLVMDTDETLVITEDYDRSLHKEDCIMIDTPGEHYTYPRDRIFKNYLGWQWKGAAHEFPHSSLMKTKARDRSLKLILRPKPPGYLKHIKRNLDLLLEDLKQNPDDSRTLFYVGTSYRDLGDIENARKYLQKRVEQQQSWQEERFYAMYVLAVMSANKKEYQRAENEYLLAHELRPNRAEPLYNLAKMCNEQGQRNKAIMFLEKAKDLEKPIHESIFLEEPIYDYMIDFELSHMYFYTPDKFDKGYELCLSVAEKPGIPEKIREQNFVNMQFYDKKKLLRGDKDARFILHVPQKWDGLGDHIMFSHIPRIAKAMYPNCNVYVSRFQNYKTEGTKELVWDNNSYVSGFVNAYGTALDMQKVEEVLYGRLPIPGMDPFVQIALFYGLNILIDDDEELLLPIINLRGMHTESVVPDAVGRSIIDPNSKIYSGIRNQDHLNEFIKKKDYHFDYQVSQLPGTNYYEIEGVPKLEIKDIFEYAAMIEVAGTMHYLMSGGSLLSYALNRPGVVFDGEGTRDTFKFKNFHEYINIYADLS